MNQVLLRPANSENWRDIAHLQVTQSQREFVAEPCYYLALCCYGNDWHPLVIYLGEQVVGFMMWAVDPADDSCWLGGILIDQSYQRKGYGRRAVQGAISMLAKEYGYKNFALSYQPTNLIAKHLYNSLGFSETDEWEGDEIVARLSLAV
jgi:diamine N-acetyltransferase